MYSLLVYPTNTPLTIYYIFDTIISMKANTQTIEYVELQTLTPELGLFVISGSMNDIEAVQHDFRGQSVSQSTFDRIAYGRASRKLVPWFL